MIKHCAEALKEPPRLIELENKLHETSNSSTTVNEETEIVRRVKTFPSSSSAVVRSYFGFYGSRIFLDRFVVVRGCAPCILDTQFYPLIRYIR